MIFHTYSPKKFAIVRRITTTQSAIFGGPTSPLWNEQVYDTHGFHSLTANPERLTIPTGHNGFYFVCGQLELSAAATSYGHLCVNHSDNLGNTITQYLYTTVYNTTSNWCVQTTYGPTMMSGGDVIKLDIYQYMTNPGVNNIIVGNARTWLGIFGVD